MPFISFIMTVTLLFTFSGEAKTMSIFKNNFEKRWEELFKDVEKLNQYTTKAPISLRDVKVQNYNIDGAIFSNAIFKSIEWAVCSSQKASYTKVIFENCKFIQSDFSYSNFTDVQFINCEFFDSDFNRSNLVGVIFKSCKFDQMGLVENKGDLLKMENCTILDSGLGDSAIDFEFKDCTFDGVDISVSKGGHKLLIEGGLLSEVDFGDSHFSDVTLRRVRQGGAGKIQRIYRKKYPF